MKKIFLSLLFIALTLFLFKAKALAQTTYSGVDYSATGVITGTVSTIYNVSGPGSGNVSAPTTGDCSRLVNDQGIDEWWKTSMDACRQFLGPPQDVCCQPGENCPAWQFTYANDCWVKLNPVGGSCLPQYKYSNNQCQAADRCEDPSIGNVPGQTGGGAGSGYNTNGQVLAGSCDASKFNGSDPNTACVSGGWYKTCCSSSGEYPVTYCSLGECPSGQITAAGTTSCLASSTCDGTTYTQTCNNGAGVQTCQGKNGTYDPGCDPNCTTCQNNYCAEAGYSACTPGQPSGTCTKNGQTCTGYTTYECSFNGQAYCGPPFSPNVQTCDQPCTGPPPTPTISTSLSCISNGYTAAGFNISWGSSTPAVTYVDISTSSSFSTFYNKYVGGSSSTTAPDGFNGYLGVSGALVFQPSTTYYVRLFNDTQHSNIATFTTPILCAAPTPTPAPLAAPTNLSGSCPAPGTQASLSWNPVSGPASVNVGYIYTVRKANDAWSALPYPYTYSTQATWSPTQAGTSYAWAVQAYYNYNNNTDAIYSLYSYGTFTCLTTCQAPTLSATTKSANQIDLNWSAPAGALVYAGSSLKQSSPSWTSIFNNYNLTSYSHTGLDKCSTYQYTVAAYCPSSSSWSAWSSQASATTLGCGAIPTPAVNSPSCTPTDTNSLYTISWSAAAPPITYVDISTSSNFSTFYNKNVSGTSTTASSGFNLYPGGTSPLTFQPNTTYYLRLFNGSIHSSTVTFTTPPAADPVTGSCTAPSGSTPTSTPAGSTCLPPNNCQASPCATWLGSRDLGFIPPCSLSQPVGRCCSPPADNSINSYSGSVRVRAYYDQNRDAVWNSGEQEITGLTTTVWRGGSYMSYESKQTPNSFAIYNGLNYSVYVLADAAEWKPLSGGAKITRDSRNNADGICFSVGYPCAGPGCSNVGGYGYSYQASSWSSSGCRVNIQEDPFTSGAEDCFGFGPGGQTCWDNHLKNQWPEEYWQVVTSVESITYPGQEIKRDIPFTKGGITPWIQVRGDVHSNTGINAPGGP